MSQDRPASLHCAFAALVFLSLGVSPVSRADASTERAELVRILREIENLELIVQDAEAASVSTQRIRFQYGWLRGDLEKIKAGIREYLDTAPVTPRVPVPLGGDYIR